MPNLFKTARRVAVILTLLGGVVAAGPATADQPPPQRFIVTLADSVSDPGAVAAEHAQRHGAEVAFVYRNAIKGYAATFRGSGASDVGRDQRVTRVEPDSVVTASATTTQSGATWGLDRIDQGALPLSGGYSYTNTGSNVTAYIIDTGIRVTHTEFGGRATSGRDFVNNDFDADDCNGHGTHVAGTVGGSTYGVAKSVKLVAVRVLDCGGSGYTSGVIAGVDWVATHHRSPAVANMSLGGGANTTLDNAVVGSISKGVTYAIAAGNSSRDACKFSPARVTAALTIGATTRSDARATWSNHGNCVDWFAPGAGITSAWHSSDSAENTISGTSMAAPHTAGAAALYLDGQPGATPAQVRQVLYDATTKGIVRSAKSVNNHLLFTDL